jgi:hypothetical protein
VNIIGIDPGAHGAICFMDSYGGVAVFDLPIITDGKLKWVDGGLMQSLLLAHGHSQGHVSTVQTGTAYVERVSAWPGQGVSSSFNFGVNLGSILSILQARGLPIELVTPGTWKKALGLSKDKTASLHKARLLYPDLELHLAKHEGRAEAILIAHYARTLAWKEKT